MPTFNTRERTDYIVVHCSATRPHQDIGAEEITKWHKAAGFKDIGYHYVIRRDGVLERGRPDEAVGSHVKGFNEVSVGICLVGGVKADDPFKPDNNFTPEQFVTLKTLLTKLKEKYPKAKIQGHRDFPKVGKDCPCFDVKAWVKASKLV